MVKAMIKFKATNSLFGYGGPQGFHDGDEKEIEAIEAKRLCKDYPDNFSFVKPDVAEKPPEKVEKEKSVESPSFNRSVKPPEKDK